MLTTDQLQERLKYVTATDAAVVCGISPWKNPIQLWQEKSRLVVAEDKSELPWIKAGHYLEEPIAQWFADDTGKELTKDDSLRVHKDIPYMAAHIDRLVKNESAAVECKTSRFSHGWGDGENIMPDYYLIQCVHEAACWDLERVYMATLIGGSDFRKYTYERNHKLEDLLISKVKAFWEFVQNGIAPPPTTGEEVISLYGYQTNEDVVTATPDVERAFYELCEIKEKIKEFQEDQKRCEDKIKVFMGKAPVLKVSDGNIAVTWKKSKDSCKLDIEKLRKENLDIYEKYYTQITKGPRKFLVK